MPEYDAIRIRLERLGPDSDEYRVHAATAIGETTGTFTVPVSHLELENLVLRMSRPRTGVRGPGSVELQTVRRFGSDLFSALFTGAVRDLYRDGLANARLSHKGLRITLGLTDTPELMDLPWEYLYEKPDFISISTWTPVVRYLELPRSRPPIEVTPPLRVLALVSSPSDAQTLDVARERHKLEQALSEATKRGAAEIHWVERATLSELLRALRRNDFHVFHYIGHGVYDSTIGDGVLLFEDEAGKSRRVSGDQLGTMLADETTLRLAVLNACEGARASTSDPFAGVATSLVEREIPAVVAMQFEITDEAAITFADEFYAAIADGYPVDSALAEARRLIYANGNETEWATPVLFMRVPDGRIFDVPAPVERREIEPEPPPPVPPPLPPEPPDEPEEDEVEESEPIPVLWTALVLGIGVMFMVGLVYEWDEAGRAWVDRRFGAGAGALGNLLSAVSPLMLAVGTFFAALLAHLSPRSPRSRMLAGGMLVGLGVSGAAKYGGLVLWRPELEGVNNTSLFILALVAASSIVLAVLGTKLAARGKDRYATGKPRIVAGGLALVGATLVLAACLVPYNDGRSKSIIPDDGWFALDPLVGVIVALGAIFVGRGTGQAGAGALIAVGAVGVALWPRFIGVPILLDGSANSAGPGGFIGLLGSSCLLASGLVLASPLWRKASPPGDVHSARST
jgi:hypothetical protein